MICPNCNRVIRYWQPISNDWPISDWKAASDGLEILCRGEGYVHFTTRHDVQRQSVVLHHLGTVGGAITIPDISTIRVKRAVPEKGKKTPLRKKKAVVK